MTTPKDFLKTQSVSIADSERIERILKSYLTQLADHFDKQRVVNKETVVEYLNSLK